LRNDANEHGYRGAAWAGASEKVATHGCISPWDINNSLVAAGPSFKRGLLSDAPAGNIDIAPTLARLLALPDDAGYDGRVLEEALAGGPEPAALPVERALLTAESRDGRYTQRIRVSTVVHARYVDYGEVER
jgi:arylsulfatase A-like enzyme